MLELNIAIRNIFVIRERKILRIVILNLEFLRECKVAVWRMLQEIRENWQKKFSDKWLMLLLSHVFVLDPFSWPSESRAIGAGGERSSRLVAGEFTIIERKLQLQVKFLKSGKIYFLF